MTALGEDFPRNTGSENLLLNSEFHFQSFDNSREGKPEEFSTGSVPFWDQAAYGDAVAYRSPRVPGFRPRFLTEGVVVLRPGKSLRQFSTLAELGLEHGDAVSFSIFGFQNSPGALRVTLSQVQLDNAPGDWSPGKFGQNDSRSFPRHARGEWVRVPVVTGLSGPGNDFELNVENAVVRGSVVESKTSTEAVNTVAFEVELTNTSTENVWIYAPCLVAGARAGNRLPSARPLPDFYRALPKTIGILRRGGPLHIIVMGSSIDRGSANPPLYLYDENPASPHFKEPISAQDLIFDGARIGHPEWTPFYGQWRHYFSYAGRLRQALLRRYRLPQDRILLNFMSADGSSIGEAHSALEAWSSLALPPDPETNGQCAGQTWQERYPALFSRPEGPRPDLVIFGSGANERTGGADEIALYEGAIRWFQRHYPEMEFVFCVFQNRERYTPATGMLKELSLRYGIPYLDFGRELSLATRHGNSYAFVPKDGHPQAAAHDLWSRLLEKAFQPVDPMQSGWPQQYMPARASALTLGTEGEMRHYPGGSPRLRGGKAFIFDDTFVNLWTTGAAKVHLRVDGVDAGDAVHQNGSLRRSMKERDLRNSTFAINCPALGDRHVVEVVGAENAFIGVDAKMALNRAWTGVESRQWRADGSEVEPFLSAWGAPYGSSQIVLAPGNKALLNWVGTACSVAWVDQARGGTLLARIDGRESWRQPTDRSFTLASGEATYLENRRGILSLPYGMHRLEVEAVDGPVRLLGAFSYDTRPNRNAERVVEGMASPGDRIQFSTPFAAPPVVTSPPGLNPVDLSREGVRFEGEKSGLYQARGE